MGFRLREMRERRGLTTQQMVQRLGVKEDRYRKWEQGVNGVPLEHALACCEVLRCSLDELAGRVIPALAPDEQCLLDLYRSTDDRGRLVIMSVAESQQGVEGQASGALTGAASA